MFTKYAINRNASPVKSGSVNGWMLKFTADRTHEIKANSTKQKTEDDKRPTKMDEFDRFKE